MNNFESNHTPEKQDYHLSYSEISEEGDLDILKENHATFDGISFDYDDNYISELKGMLQDPNSIQVMATTEDGEFAGYVAASEKLFPDNLFMADIFVNPKIHGQGIGAELVQRVIDKAKSVGLEGVITETNPKNIPAQKLFEKMGFVQIDNPNFGGLTYSLHFEEDKNF